MRSEWIAFGIAVGCLALVLIVVTTVVRYVLQAGIYPMKSVDGSGAGDAFDAGFITGMLEAWPLEKTLRFASAVGASCTRALGTTAGVFQFDEAVRFIEEHSLEIKQVNG